EHVASADVGADLGVVERGTVEEARLGLRGDAPAPRGNAVDRREVLVLAAAVPPAGARQVERAGVVHREAAGRRHADAARAAAGCIVALAADVDGGGEARGQGEGGAG